MLSDTQTGSITRDELNNRKEEALAELYKASRDTVRKARNKVLSDASDN
jgi:hypothetical protein